MAPGAVRDISNDCIFVVIRIPIGTDPEFLDSDHDANV